MSKAPAAMISRIRVEARGESMDACQEVIRILLDHARTAGYLEGVVPQSSAETEPHFGWVTGADKWSDLGLSFEGRIALKFDPEVTNGGLREFGYAVVVDDRQGPEEIWPANNGEDVTNKVIVLQRMNPVTRDHSWEKSSSFGTLQQTHDGGDLATFNRARHDRVGEQQNGTHILIEVWLQGVTEGTRDLPTRIQGLVSAVLPQHVTASGGDFFPDPPETIFEYVHDLSIGDDIESEIEEVFEKIRIYAEAYVAAQRAAYEALTR